MLPLTFSPSFVSKDRYSNSTVTNFKVFPEFYSCHSVAAADFDFCGMGRADGYDLFFCF